MQDGSRIAAVDLGSNSFRLEIGRIEHQQFYRTEYLKETVRQGGGLDEQRNLTPQAMQRGWECLARFGERLAGFAPHEVKAVATQTLREARNRDVFLSRASQLLGFPIEVISGQEEARLIYRGVAQALPPSDERRLVIDIGGRSTELILGRGLVPETLESYRLGSVAWSQRYFADGLLSRRNFQVAEIAAQAVLNDALSLFPAGSWDAAYGSAGTVNAVVDVLVASGWPAGHISREGLDWLWERLLQAQTAERLRLPGMRDDRKPIIGGGVSILRALFDLLGLQRLEQAPGGLRHGLLMDMLGRDGEHRDLRLHSVQRLARQFQTDATQGRRVAQVALKLFGHMLQAPHLRAWDGDVDAELTLQWAAHLHEIGRLVAHDGYHKHSAYILDNTDAQGFNLSELHRLSQLVLGHKGKLHKLDADFEDPLFCAQLLSLRLGVALCHARRDPDLNGVAMDPPPEGSRTWMLTLPEGWSERFPQSRWLIEEECQAWQRTPWGLAVTPASA